MLWDREKPVTHAVPYYGRARATRTVALPRGYLLPKAWGHVAEKVWRHGLRIERTLEPMEMEVEVYRVKKITCSCWSPSLPTGS